MNNEKIFFYKLYEDVTSSEKYSDDCDNYYKYSRLANNDEQDLMRSLLNKSTYVKSINIDDFCRYLNILEKQDIDKQRSIISEIIKDTSDEAQLNTFNRILKIKKWKNYKDTAKIRKRCPRCNYATIASEDTEYVICGYVENKGYDRKGCGYDWCFKCGKKLCKFWELNNLFDKYNRFHNSKCCKSYAYHTDDIYPDNFCQCKNEHVFRDRV